MKLKHTGPIICPRFRQQGTISHDRIGEESIPETYLPTFVPDANGQLVPNILTTVDGVPIFKEYAYFPGMELSLKPNNTYIAGLRLEQPIYTGGKITSAYRMAKLGVEMARLNEEKTRAEVIVEADVAYWTYVEALELEKTAHTYKELLTQLHKDVENAFNAGMVPRNNLLKVDVKLNEADLQLMRAENGVRLSRMNLCHVVGLPLYSDVEVEDSSVPEELAEVPLPDWLPVRSMTCSTKQIKLKRGADSAGEERLSSSCWGGRYYGLCKWTGTEWKQVARQYRFIGCCVGQRTHFSLGRRSQ